MIKKKLLILALIAITIMATLSIPSTIAGPIDDNSNLIPTIEFNTFNPSWFYLQAPKQINVTVKSEKVNDSGSSGSFANR